MTHSRRNVDVSADLRGALAPVVTRNRAAITDPLRIGDLLRAIDAYRGQPATEAALKLAPLTFVRPGELRAAQWSELQLDGENPEWRIPKARMKMDEEHVVPLSQQAIAVFREIEPLTGGGKYVFPSLRGGHRPISENTVNVALRNMGFAREEMTGHGFRAMASTCPQTRQASALSLSAAVSIGSTQSNAAISGACFCARDTRDWMGCAIAGNAGV